MIFVIAIQDYNFLTFAYLYIQILTPLIFCE